MRKLSLLAVAVLSGLAFCANAAAKQPNIIVIFADDLGYGDLGCYGHPSIRTPHLDRMAAEGLRFTDFYTVANVCTPSRAALLTGRYPVRSGMAGGAGRHVLYPSSEGGLPTSEVTIAGALRGRGYATACIGKWHLGRAEPYLPTNHGFDYFFGLPYSNDMDPVNAKVRRPESLSQNPDFKNFNVPLVRNTQIIERPADQSTLTKRYTEETIRFIRQNRKKPFFIYLAHTFPHVPLFASKDFKGKSLRGAYGDTIEELDWSVGEILKALRSEKLADNTLVLFTSDNGPWLVMQWNGGSGGLLRDGKAGTWEGGHRVPAIAWWPGRIPAGRVTSDLACTMDLFTTSLKLAGAPLPNDRPLDGVDLSAMLFGKGPSPRDTLFYYYGDTVYATRKGPFKAHFTTHDGYSKEPPQSHEPPLLFQLAHDPSEQFNVAAEHPRVVADIKRVTEEHNRTMQPGKPQY